MHRERRARGIKNIIGLLVPKSIVLMQYIWSFKNYVLRKLMTSDVSPSIKLAAEKRIKSLSKDVSYLDSACRKIKGHTSTKRRCRNVMYHTWSRTDRILISKRIDAIDGTYMQRKERVQGNYKAKINSFRKPREGLLRSEMVWHEATAATF